MSWLRYVTTIALIAWLALGAIYTVLEVGKERKPMGSGTAAIQMVIQAGLILAAITSAGWFEGR